MDIQETSLACAVMCVCADIVVIVQNVLSIFSFFMGSCLFLNENFKLIIYEQS